MTGECKQVEIAGITVAWDVGAGLNLWDGVPALSMWIPSTVAGVMSGVQRMVGTDRFNLSLQAGGRDSIAGDWALISRYPNFEEGFTAWADTASAAGWGRWRILSLDRA